MLAQGELTVDRAGDRLGRRPLQYVDHRSQTLEQLEARLRLLDPMHTLSRGWSLTRTSDGRLVRSAADVTPGEQLLTTVADGTITSRAEAAAVAADDNGTPRTTTREP